MALWLGGKMTNLNPLWQHWKKSKEPPESQQVPGSKKAEVGGERRAMNVNREEMKKISEEVGQVIADVQEARKQSRQAEWFSLAALAISVIRFIIELVSVSQC